MAGWTPEDALESQKGRLLKPALNNFRLALNERLEGVGLSLLPNPNIPEIEKYDQISADWFYWFDYYLLNVIFPAGLYVNHTIDSGFWEGNLEAVPFFTQQSMLEAIGDAGGIGWVSAPNDPQLCASWLRQRYKVINMLRWVHHLIDTKYTAGPIGWDIEEKIGTSNISAEDALSNYAIASWSSASIWSYLSSEQTSYTEASSLWIVKSTRTIIENTKYFPTNGFTPKIDVYVRMIDPNPSSTSLYVSESGYIENKIYKMISNEPFLMDGTKGQTIGTIQQQTNNSTFPDDDPISTFWCYGQGGANLTLILKYDDQFVYKDW